MCDNHFIYRMLSKSKGQDITCLHVLFCEDTSIIPSVDEAALVAAENYVDVCSQHVAFIAGRGLIDLEIKRFCDSKLRPT